MANAFICGPHYWTNAIQAANAILAGCEVMIVQGDDIAGIAIRDDDAGSYVLTNRRLGNRHTLAIAHTDRTRLACHLEGFATA